MVSKIEPDRYADTGFSIADTPLDVNALLFKSMMAKSGAERLAIGCRMADSARQLVWSGIPTNLPEAARRSSFLRRYYGEDFSLAISDTNQYQARFTSIKIT